MASSTTADAEELRFTQFWISNHFQVSWNGASGGGSIKQAVADIRAHRLAASQFPSLRVVKHEGFLWSLDNRRLWVFRKAKVSQVNIRIVPATDSTVGGRRFLQLIEDFKKKPRLLKHMSSLAYFPVVKEKVSLSPSPSTAQENRPDTPDSEPGNMVMPGWDPVMRPTPKPVIKTRTDSAINPTPTHVIGPRPPERERGILAAYGACVLCGAVAGAIVVISLYSCRRRNKV